MRNIGLLVVPDFHVISLFALTVFELANRRLKEPAYKIHVLSETGEPVQASLGITISTSIPDDTPLDTLFIGASLTPTMPPQSTVDLLRKMAPNIRRVASVCLGSFALAGAGLLDGRRATTHWRYTQQLRDTFPDIDVVDDHIFVRDGIVWTSAGMSTAVDMALTMLEDDFGSEIAGIVAKGLVMERWRRSGAQSQHSTLLDHAPRTDRIHDVITFARENLRAPLTLDVLAEVARMSKRQFSRRFKEETGLSPAKAIERLRIETARERVMQSAAPIGTIAHETGFADIERMRRAFVRAYGESPQAVRQAAKGERAEVLNKQHGG